jgi:hypothetical protein
MYCVNEKIEIKGFIGQTFLATINGALTQLPINAETKFGCITKIVPGESYDKENSYMIKFMCYEFPVEVDEDYITKCHYKACP